MIGTPPAHRFRATTLLVAGCLLLGAGFLIKLDATGFVVTNVLSRFSRAPAPVMQDKGPALAAKTRREALALGTAALMAPAAPAFAAGAAGSDGSWAKHFEEFNDADFEGFQTTESGLKYKVFEEGFGVKPQKGQKIKAHYAGYLLNGAKFDASYDRRKPLEFAVGTGSVIKGWDEALLDMKVGEKRILRIPSSLGYGSRGAGGVIPPDATLVFYVELVTLAA
jgi:FKBP-type peptidyl-prolyl cis-trans isomerase